MKKGLCFVLMISVGVLIGGQAFAQSDRAPTKASWPAAEEADFMKECATDPMEGISKEKQLRYCSCSLEYMKSNYTYAETSKMGDEYGKNPKQMPIGMVKAAANCMDRLYSLDEFLGQFMAGCMEDPLEGVTRDVQKSFCSCAINGLKARQTYAQLVEMALGAANNKAGAMNPMAAAAKSCEHILKPPKK